MAAEPRSNGRRALPGSSALTRRTQVEPTQVVAAAGSAIVTGARVGRILGRSAWRVARQLPGAERFEREAQRIQQAALHEVRRALDLPQSMLANAGDEQSRAVLLIGNSDGDQAPLRSAMSELLERSIETDRTSSREYLFGTIISQLVPDEARILAFLSDGRAAASADVVTKAVGRSRVRTELAHASTVGRNAGVANPENTPTYLTRLLGFGLVRFGSEDSTLGTEYEILATDASVQAAQATAEARKHGSVRLARGTVSLTDLGRQFWVASDPSRATPPSSSRKVTTHRAV
ncbi:MAG: Abi-alpha family protein [Jatrophihabitantaceae bacterium]